MKSLKEEPNNCCRTCLMYSYSYNSCFRTFPNELFNIVTKGEAISINRLATCKLLNLRS